MKSLFIAFTLAIFMISEVSAQVVQPGRLEIPVEYNDENFEVVSAEESGIILFRKVKNTDTRTEYKYQVMVVDTALNVVWENYYFISLRYLIRGYDYFGDYFYLLFQRNTESLKADLFIMRINLKSQISETFLIEREYAMELTEFEVLGNTLIFSGLTNSMPTIICYQFGNPAPKALPGFFEDKTQIQHLQTNDKLRTFNVLTNFRTQNGTRSLSLKTFDEFGEMIKNISLQPSEEKSLLFGRAISLNPQSDLIVGTYTRKRSDVSRGIFIARVAENGEHTINYYNYADLKNFFSYMKARRQKRVEARISRRKVKGKKVRFNYRLLVHDVTELDGKYIMVGEAFYPKYSNNAYYMGNWSNTRYRGTNAFFEGYKYTHAVVFGFDRRGRLLWDNSFEINDVISYNLDQFVHVSVNDDEMALVYIYENEIRSKVIQGNEVLEGKTFNELKLSFEDDIVSNTENTYGGLKKWYGGSLFVYGIQKINKQNDVYLRRTREVFFINKLVYK